MRYNFRSYLLRMRTFTSSGTHLSVLTKAITLSYTSHVQPLNYFQKTAAKVVLHQSNLYNAARPYILASGLFCSSTSSISLFGFLCLKLLKTVKLRKKCSLIGYIVKWRKISLKSRTYLWMLKKKINFCSWSSLHHYFNLYVAWTHTQRAVWVTPTGT